MVKLHLRLYRASLEAYLRVYPVDLNNKAKGAAQPNLIGASKDVIRPGDVYYVIDPQIDFTVAHQASLVEVLSLYESTSRILLLVFRTC